MAAGIISPPNTAHGPCESCEHRDCAESRKIAATVCRFCQKQIGYGVRFYQDEDDYVHADCLEDEIDNRET